MIFNNIMNISRKRIFAAMVGAIALGASLSAFAATIHEAVRADDAQEVRKMIGANRNMVNAKNELGSTPLHIAATNSTPDMAKLLIEKGAAVNAKDNNGLTPLHIAAFSGHKDNLNLLIAKGADVHAKDNKGKTALDYADELMNREISAILVMKMLVTPKPAAHK
jgi:ankyrin repeat protein